MKKLVLFITLMIFIQSCEKDNDDIKVFLNENWKRLPIETDANLTKIFFIDDQTGFVASEPSIDTIKHITKYNFDYKNLLGTPTIIRDSTKYYSYQAKIVLSKNHGPSFFKTTDKGNTWTSLATPFASQITDIFFLDENYGFVTTEYEGVFKTTDGGKVWTKVMASFSFPGDGAIVLHPHYMIRFFNKMEGFVQIDNGNYYMRVQTQDGGLSWNFLSNNADKSKPLIISHRASILPDNKTGLLINRYGKIYKTTDRGANWNLIRETNGFSSDASFLNEDMGYYITPQGILKTNDGGKNWEEIQTHFPNTPLIDPYSQIFAFETGEIITTNLSDGKIYLSKDGGANFSLTLDVGEKQLNDISFPTHNTGFAIGNHGQIFKYSKK
ncbi:WD40/YVTN/BNR-like repeat-containing protein [Adhaeribacter aquaticus]|uniref:WD40/YVTN/BNR-like repeat-containing protein n=1 Tax=Adhaeribacter aquaticus TaxID=299567 RepID=UPI0004266E5C|nr:YCF48-related protein [Adhaeribacter aquaticus]